MRIAWMKFYKGNTKQDKPIGAGAYVQENEDGGEVCNFLDINGLCYGYARMPPGRNIDIKREGASPFDTSVNDVDVIFIATNPKDGGQYIVGFYNNAIVYKKPQTIKNKKRGNHNNYVCLCPSKSAFLVSEKDRVYDITGAGQANIWHASEYLTNTELRRLTTYLLKVKGSLQTARKSSGSFNSNIKANAEAEMKAMEYVKQYFESNEFKVIDIHKDNLGWDFTAIKNTVEYQLEVKGLSGNFTSIDLTPNEFDKMENKKSTYLVCIVSNLGTGEAPKLDLISYYGSTLKSDSGIEMKITKIIGARISRK